MDLPSFPEIAVRVQKGVVRSQVVRGTGGSRGGIGTGAGGAAAADREFRVAQPQRPAPSPTCAPPSTASATTWCAAPRSPSRWRKFARATSWPAWSTISTISGNAVPWWRRFRYVLARKCTKVNPDEAMLTGMMHGIGKLYVLTRVIDHPELFVSDTTLNDIIGEWHASIGKAILENWDFSEAMAQAVGEQADFSPRRRRTARFERCHRRRHSHGCARRGCFRARKPP